MIVTATSASRVDLGVAARLFHGLSDPTRLAILLAMLEGERRVTDLVAAVGGSESNVSNHVACLRECGLVVEWPAERRPVVCPLARPGLVEEVVARDSLRAAAGREVGGCPNPFMDTGCGPDCHG